LRDYYKPIDPIQLFLRLYVLFSQIYDMIVLTRGLQLKNYHPPENFTLNYRADR
jgi:hypothetical protein